MLTGIRVVKFMGWEEPFRVKISTIRNLELSVANCNINAKFFRRFLLKNAEIVWNSP